MTNCTNLVRKALAHPFAKRLAVASLIVVVASALRTWLGEPLVLNGLFVGVGSYVFADWLCSTKSERKARLQQISAFFREHSWSTTKWGVCILMCAYFLVSRSEPSEPAVKQVLSLVQIFGLVVVFVVPIITGTISMAISGSWTSVSDLVSRFLGGLVFYSIALWLIGRGGDDLYRWMLAHPNEAAIDAAALVIVWMIVSCGRSSFGSERIVGSSSEATMAAAGVVVNPTARDNRYIAAHETGHALVYAALGGLPGNVKLAVNDHLDGQGTLGFITGITSRHHLDEKSFVEWYMLVFLAGKLGEAFMYGESTLGSSSDHVRWLGLARNYLANHYRGVYYAEPKNKFEQEQNEVKLEALQAEQLATLRTFFDMNDEVFKQLADELLQVRTMGRDDLFPFLSRVKLPDGFPLPFGPFEVYSAEWQDS